MPFEVRQRGEQWCVVRVNPRAETAEATIKCHATRADAQAQATAIRLNEMRGEGRGPPPPR